MTTDSDRRRRREKPRKATPDSLERAALHYLRRYASSSENLRRVLMRRVLRSAEAHGTDPEDGAAVTDALINRYQSSGLLDDANYARLRAESLHGRGASARLIRTRLMAKGVDAEDIDAALAALDDLTMDTELAAACNYARRRRIGPWRRADREAHREGDLAALGRQGFGYETARKVIEAADTDELLAEASDDAPLRPSTRSG